MLSECLRNRMAVDCFERWFFVVTLDLFRAVDAELINGCYKLQCLRHCAQSRVSLSAHRALSDCLVLRDVTVWLAERLGHTVEVLLGRFAVIVNMQQTIVNMSSVL